MEYILPACKITNNILPTLEILAGILLTMPSCEILADILLLREILANILPAHEING
jgi:hypothetical protein